MMRIMMMLIVKMYFKPNTHIADADATQLDSCVASVSTASAVCMGMGFSLTHWHRRRRRGWQGGGHVPP